jgi:hypothetical protein
MGNNLPDGIYLENGVRGWGVAGVFWVGCSRKASVKRDDI